MANPKNIPSTMTKKPDSLRERVRHDHTATEAHFVAVSIEFLIHHAASLKEKRHVVASVKDRLRARFNASVAEIGALDQYQHAVLGMALVSNDRVVLEREVNAIRQFMVDVRDIELVDVAFEWM